MKIIDANIVLRYLLKDNLSLHKKVVEIIDTQQLAIGSKQPTVDTGQ